jgi:hypothetical protein
MTRDRVFEIAVLDGGALGAAAIDIATRRIVAGFAHDGLVPPALLDLLLGAVLPRGPLTWVCGGPPPSTARELMVAGTDRALFCAVLDRGELIVLAAPVAMSVALGWALVRNLAAAERTP